ncbi:MAG: diacylglycerol kinase [Candidatus Levybacteria bacterium CG_4_10_14_0_2_um_filter_36_16]|nr:MAG: hypothetical protein AUK12_00265 [Candidatus Levybacteria bacterium CG2_30_37_29]PIR78814.1 MAG: diacylglycerol kinase [Candidatus Levybacteria bacterium CG10_big_fil_rev_8_21_14_0_10_36_30]PIZ97548.1 MAG: diacylglycerol kinase [Candidatus Levybacteria bacterium CG_4_10_14_0_2_um_filter_36_16]PJA90098.1 MAG: diacylglycerol kinase [Candidatus Levybacteria bacterium CG_4_9_14_3_um_filter_36_7]
MIEHRSLLQSFHHAWAGVVFAVKNNQNIRIHFIIAVLVVIVGFVLNVSAFEIGILGVMILFVFSAEMINTAIEEMTNLITREHRAEAKIAKDVSAGMVLVVSVGAAMVGILVFLPHILELTGI